MCLEKMTRLQIIVVSLWAFLTLALYFGFDTKSSEQLEDLEVRALSGTKVDVSPIILSVKESLTDSDLREIQVLEGGAESSEGDQKVDYLKQLSGKWYKLRRFLIAGHYAEQIAELAPSGEAWSIAGTTYFQGLNDSDKLVKDGCFQGAVGAFENAVSLEPENVNHRVNLALTYTENPPQENPMKGIQILLNLNQKHPENVVVLTTLGRLAMKTGQYEKAEERLQDAVNFDPNHQPAVCLLADLYQQTADSRAATLREQCELLTKKL